MRAKFTVTRKVAFGYLVIIVFSLLAIGYALISLHDHNLRTEQLVGGQFRAFTLLRDIRQNLLGQENLEKQLLILRDPQLLGLLELRISGLETTITDVNTSALPDYFATLPTKVENYLSQTRQLMQVFAAKDWKKAAKVSATTTAPLRSQLLDQLADLRIQHQTVLDNDLHDLSLQSSKAYRLTLIITLVGILLSAPVALTVIISIHRSVKALTKATRDIAAGSFETQIDIRGNDEFSQLAQDFSGMARKLMEFEQLNLDANPLTRLPGNLAIDRELKHRIAQNLPFAHLYIDLDNFKAYGDHYGYHVGSDAINMVGNLLREVVDLEGGEGDLVGHIGGDDYVVLTAPDRGEALAKAIISKFDSCVPELYTKKDLEAGFILGTDRHGIKRSFPLLTISIAITLSENLDHPSLLEISNNCARMKGHLKQLQNSNYLIDRRKQIP
ncbi:diguanylate cyclase domain-containing protein [Geopsychrobacter electrodiphilus]|uniref:diguanylate cyclase domain-containing protein n=1 Tax=Geopsychrobacter electrodiphilus TaxID=225196 RepID=UPI00037F7B47|nr:diguanylate cyclase [Geopsychrobacter electrodiphilus]